MTAQEFLNAILQRTGAEAVNLRAVNSVAGCDMHLFFGAAALSYHLEDTDWQDALATVEGIGHDVDAARKRSGGRL